VFFGFMGSVLGLVADSVGGLMLALLAGCCVLRMGTRALSVLTPVVLPLAFAASHIAVQGVAYGEPIIGEEARIFAPWILGVVIIQCLALRRGFLHRCAIAIFLIGISTLPYLSYYRGSDRIGLDLRIPIANPNDLGAWFGFCCVYFAILGLETRRMSVRVMSGLAATGSLFIMALTVSRAPLFAAAVSILVAFRRVLHRGFAPLLCLVGVAWIGYELGLFDQSASLYSSRGLEDTGRLLIWPLAIERFFNSPLTGVGAFDVATLIPGNSAPVTPHNSFLLVALASGILPLLLYVGYWVRSGVEAFRLNAHSHEDAVFLIPLFLYAFMIALELNQPYMFFWAMATLGTLGANGFLLKVRQAVARRIGPRQSATRPGATVLSAPTRS